MKNFTIQSLHLIMMLAVVLGLAIDNRAILLRLIERDARNMLEEGISKEVPKPPRNQTICVKEFFCYALKSLEQSDLGNTSLARHIMQYNKNKTEPGCVLPGHQDYSLTQLLKDTINCAQRFEA